MTGLVNAHTHLYSGLARLGMPAPDPPPRDFVDNLRRIWWRLDRALDETALRAGARLYVAEALLAGTTALIDHHESPEFIDGSLDVLADACQDLGMRAFLCYGATERNGGRDEARRGLAECARFIRGNRRPLVRGAVGLHATFTVSDDTIREAGALCRDLGAVLHVHLAEGTVDVEDARARGFAGPLERLIALDALPAGSVLAHGVHLAPEQVSMAADRGCWLVQNPRSNRKNGVGYPSALRRSTLVGLGTDGFPADMVDELDVLAESATANGDDLAAAERRLVSGWQLVASIFDAPVDRPGRPGDGWRAWAVRQRDAARQHYGIDGRVIVDAGRLVSADLGRIRDEAHDAA
jgi:cytosine/adenosine deaminase-related metal-dependent hydrolase